MVSLAAAQGANTITLAPTSTRRLTTTAQPPPMSEPSSFSSPTTLIVGNSTMMPTSASSSPAANCPQASSSASSPARGLEAAAPHPSSSSSSLALSSCDPAAASLLPISSSFTARQDSLESHQRPESPGVFRVSPGSWTYRGLRKKLSSIKQRGCVFQRKHAPMLFWIDWNSPSSWPSTFTSDPTSGPRCRPEPSVPGWRIRSISAVPPFKEEVVSNSWMPRTQRHQRSPETQYEDVVKVHLGSDQSSSPAASISSKDTLSSVDTQTLSELRVLSLIGSPVEVSPPQTPFTPTPPPPPAAPRPWRRVNNLRSLVVCAAMDTISDLYVHLQRDIDTQAERIGRALLLKIAVSYKCPES
eukprot:superscaffoldBa00000731_g6857